MMDSADMDNHIGDTTDRRRVEEELRETEGRYRALVETSPDGVIVHRNGRFLYANTAALRLYGAESFEQLSAHDVIDLVVPDDADLIRSRVKRATEGSSLPIEEIRLMRLDGREIPVEAAAAPVSFQGVPAIQAVIRDITERKQAEQREKQLEAHKLDFYRRTIMAATGGKLVMTESEEIDRIAGPYVARWDLTSAVQLRDIRTDIREMAGSMGMDAVTLQRLLTCAGEATSNAIKHAGGGTVTLHQSDARVIIRVDDSGPGIQALNLPDVALAIGYTTADSAGLGYKMMIATADKVYLATGPDGTMVATELMMSTGASLALDSAGL